MTRARDLADSADKDIAGTLTLDAVNASGVITGLTVEATGDTAAGDNAAMGYTSAEGLILTGQGSTGDITIKNDADAVVLQVPTGTTNVNVIGSLDVATNAVIDGTALVTGVLTTTAKAVSNGGIGIPDNVKLTFGGTGTGDLQIFHDGTNSYSAISDQGTGPLAIQSDLILLQNSGGTANLLKATEGGSVELLHSNATKLATTSAGATVTGSNFSIDATSGGRYFDFIVDSENSYLDVSHSLIIRTNGASSLGEKMRISSTGLVNIGETEESGSAGVTGKKLNVVGGLSTAYDATNAATWTGIQTGNSTNSSNNTATGLTFFHRTSSSGIAAIQSTSSAADRADLRFITRGSAGISEKLLIAGDGQFGFNTTTPSYKYDFYHDSSSTYMARFHHNGNNVNRYGIIISVGTDDNSGTNVHINFSDGNNTGVGSVSSSGGTVSYNAFSASHEVILPDADNAEGYPYGTLVETSSITYAQNSSGQDFERGIRYNVTKSSGANSKAVLGAYSGKITHETNLHFAYILGDGHILCNNSGGNIAVGDGICTSSTAGIGQKATVNPSMIIGIAQEAITFSNNTETKLVAVQYGLQQFTPWP